MAGVTEVLITVANPNLDTNPNPNLLKGIVRNEMQN